MLYTSMPLERVYHNHNKARDYARDKSTELEYKEITLPNGVVRARKSGDDYVVDGLISTDMTDYLNLDYKPGNIIKHR